jgi:hypothetical protein
MPDLYTAVVVCVAAIASPDDLAHCPQAMRLDDGGYSLGKGFTLKQCSDRLRYMDLPGVTFRFCALSPLRKGEIDSFLVQRTPPKPGVGND